MQVKLNPQNASAGDSTSAKGKLNFPGFQEILDFTSAGSESSVSVTVDGDTDKEVKILIRNTHATDSIIVKLNGNDHSTLGGGQYLANESGSISAARPTSSTYFMYCNAGGFSEASILLPSGFPKTSFTPRFHGVSGTTITSLYIYGIVFNSTSNITTIGFSQYSGGNFTAGTRITVYARRSNA